MKARTPTSTRKAAADHQKLRYRRWSAFSSKAFCRLRPILRSRSRESAKAGSNPRLSPAADADEQRPPGLTRESDPVRHSATLKRTGSTFRSSWPMSKKTVSSLIATHGCFPARARPPISCVWVCSNWLRMSPKEVSCSGRTLLSCSRISSSRSDEVGMDVGISVFYCGIWVYVEATTSVIKNTLPFEAAAIIDCASETI